ncbi:MAG TPA: FtsX-like permease family protein [Thermoanaerobaculia bacterium]|nr:FtsX-like permease family protein [Thermoanaerobaculia bacterium]
MTRLVWRNLMRNKRRTILTIGSVAIAIFLLTLLAAVLQAMTEVEDPTGASRLVARNRISLTFQLPEAYGQRLASIPDVEAVTPLDWFQGRYKDDRPENFFPRFSSDPETLLQAFPEFVLPPEQLEAWQADRAGFIAGASLAEAQGWELGDTITIEGDIYPVDLELTLRGIFRAPDSPSQERALYFQDRYLEEAMDNPGIVGLYWLLLDDPEAVPQVIQQAEAMFENSPAQLRVETQEAFVLSFVQMLGNVRFLFGSIGLAIVVSILLITANTMAMAARERTSEVAVLRTLGFRKGQVVTMVVLEAVAVGLVGGALGVLLANLAFGALQPALEASGFVFQALAADAGRAAAAVAVGLLIGLVAGLVPAWNAARLRIVDGLRQVA